MGSKEPLWTAEQLVSAAQEALNHNRLEVARRLALAASKVAPKSLSAWLILGHTAASSEDADYSFGRALGLIASDDQVGPLVTSRIPGPSRAETPESTEPGRSQSRQRSAEAPSRAADEAKGEAGRSLAQPVRRPISVAHVAIRARAWLFALDYFLALAAAEAITLLVEPRVGLSLYGFILLILLLHGSVSTDARSRRFFI